MVNSKTRLSGCCQPELVSGSHKAFDCQYNEIPKYLAYRQAGIRNDVHKENTTDCKF